MKEYEFELKLKVAQCWIDDGFVGDSEEVIELIKEGIYSRILSYAYQDVEFIVEVKPKKQKNERK